MLREGAHGDHLGFDRFRADTAVAEIPVGVEGHLQQLGGGAQVAPGPGRVGQVVDLDDLFDLFFAPYDPRKDRCGSALGQLHRVVVRLVQVDGHRGDLHGRRTCLARSSIRAVHQVRILDVEVVPGRESRRKPGVGEVLFHEKRVYLQRIGIPSLREAGVFLESLFRQTLFGLSHIRLGQGNAQQHVAVAGGYAERRVVGRRVAVFVLVGKRDQGKGLGGGIVPGDGEFVSSQIARIEMHHRRRRPQQVFGVALLVRFVEVEHLQVGKFQLVLRIDRADRPFAGRVHLVEDHRPFDQAETFDQGVVLYVEPFADQWRRVFQWQSQPPSAFAVGRSQVLARPVGVEPGGRGGFACVVAGQGVEPPAFPIGETVFVYLPADLSHADGPPSVHRLDAVFHSPFGADGVER